MKQIFVVSLALVFAGCFSPWSGDEATITISLNGGNASKTLVDLGTGIYEPDNFTYEIIMTGPRGTEVFYFNQGGLFTVTVLPGNWKIEVRAVGDASIPYPNLGSGTHFSGRILRALGEWEGTIRSGTNSIPVNMYSATEVTYFDQLIQAVGTGISDRKEIILMKNGGSWTHKQPIMIDRPIEIRAVEPVTIIRNTNNNVFFNIQPTGKVTLKGPLTLNGRNSLLSDMPIIISAGELTMYDGVILTNNETQNGLGGAVSVNGGTFTMYGGTITGNKCSPTGSIPAVGGGVYVTSGEFIMHGGTICYNKASCTGNGARGGGVFVTDGSFTMFGGTINGNQASSSTNVVEGGGVYVYNGTFTMFGGTIIDNQASNASGITVRGGGVYVSGTLPTAFTMFSGTISNNKAASPGQKAEGGGVFVFNAPFTMHGGTISYNTAISASWPPEGGGVYFDGTFFTMIGGIINGNEANGNGGGVFVSGTSTFKKTGMSIIYGVDGGSNANRTAGFGSAVHFITGSPPFEHRNSTAGYWVDLDTSKPNLAGGWGQ